MHAYHPLTGNPVYQVPYADPSKGLRDTTLRDVKKLGLYPSVTEIIDILDKPGLNVWLQDRVLESALTLPREPDEPDESFIKRIKEDAKEISRIAADKGVAIHKAIEHEFVGGKHIDPKYQRLAFSVANEIVEVFQCIFEAEKSFASNMGYGGTIDLFNENVIADIKTKEILDTSKKLAWDEHIMQLTAYAHGIGCPDAILVNIFVGWNGDVFFHYWDDPKERERGWQMFCKTWELWQIQKRYSPIKEG
jgi:hypothetical protein